MSRWEKIKHPLLLLLIAVVLSFLRFLAIAVPSWVDSSVIYPLFAVRILLTDLGAGILLLAVGAGAAMLVPCEGERTGLRRFLIRPVAVLLLILILSGIAIGSNGRWEKRIYNRGKEASHQQIRDFIEIADEAIWYSKDWHDDAEDFPELVRPIWAGTHSPHVTDTILVDYDSKTVGFAYHYVSYFVLKDITLSQSFTVPDTWDYVNTVVLGEPGAELKLYFNYKDGQEGNGYDIVCITLTMADGTVYGTNDLTDPETGRNYHLSLPTADSVFERIDDFLQRKQ